MWCAVVLADVAVVVAFPGHAQPDDDRGQVAADDERAPFGEGAQQVGRQDRDRFVADGVPPAPVLVAGAAVGAQADLTAEPG